jgi:hypothetical protein
MTFSEMTRTDRVAYFNFHGDLLRQGRADLVFALERWASICKRCDAFETRGMTAERYVSDLLESADGPLAEEVAEYVGP